MKSLGISIRMAPPTLVLLDDCDPIAVMPPYELSTALKTHVPCFRRRPRVPRPRPRCCVPRL